MGRKSRQRTRSLVAILAVSLASWVLPVQACAGLAAAAHHSGCPDCPAPCCQHGCCPGVATACAAAMPSLPTAPAPALQHIVLAPAVLDTGFQPRLREVTAAPVERPPAYSPPSTLSIRFCSFQD